MTSRRQVSAGRSEARRRTHGKKTHKHALPLRLKPTLWFRIVIFKLQSVDSQSLSQSTAAASLLIVPSSSQNHLTQVKLNHHFLDIAADKLLN